MENFDTLIRFSDIEVPEYLKDVMPGVYRILEDNRLLDSNKLNDYRFYEKDSIGSSEENPFIVNETEEYASTEAEYNLLDYFFEFIRVDCIEYKIISQKLKVDKNRTYDIIELEVTNLLDEKVREKYWFDITAGF